MTSWPRDHRNRMILPRGHVGPPSRGHSPSHPTWALQGRGRLGGGAQWAILCLCSAHGGDGPGVSPTLRETNPPAPPSRRTHTCTTGRHSPCTRGRIPGPWPLPLPLSSGPRGAPGGHAGSSVLRPQCRPSKGRKRGFCWCVDKYGQPLPGYDARGEGDVQCYGAEGN